MSVYVDEMIPCVPNPRWPWTESCHLIADNEDELNECACRIGLKREWLQKSRAGIYHYDLTRAMRQRAVAAGARQVDRSEFWNIVHRRLVYLRKRGRR